MQCEHTHTHTHKHKHTHTHTDTHTHTHTQRHRHTHTHTRARARAYKTHTHYAEDEQFNDEKLYLIKQIELLDPAYVEGPASGDLGASGQGAAAGPDDEDEM